jgi:transcriptional regulator with XRE-family HTH domain
MKYFVSGSEIMSVNDKIRLIREAKGLTQEQVAEKLGICVNAYGNIERGDNDPKLSKLQKIAEILEIPLADLIDLSEQGSLTINFNKDGKHQNIYLGSSNSELEKQQLINELKDKELAMKDREIAYLKELLDMHKQQKPTSP